MTSTIFIVFEHISNMSLRIHLTGNFDKFVSVECFTFIKVKHFNDLTTMIDRQCKKKLYKDRVYELIATFKRQKICNMKFQFNR